MPVVTTLHTILAEPDPVQRAVMDALIGFSERLVVMSSDGAALLHEVHGVDPAKIDVIPHGIPVAPERRSKDKLGVEGRSVILTFGLLSPDKGIEYVIDAMPAILARHPNTVYIVLGATHPHVKQQHGEAYRQMLQIARRAPRRRRERDLPQSLRQPRGARRVPRRGRHLRHAVPEGGAEHVGHARLRGRLREGGHLDALPLRARAARRRPRHPRSVARLRGDRARDRRSPRRPDEARRAPAARRRVRASR